MEVLCVCVVALRKNKFVDAQGISMHVIYKGSWVSSLCVWCLPVFSFSQVYTTSPDSPHPVQITWEISIGSQNPSPYPCSA